MLKPLKSAKTTKQFIFFMAFLTPIYKCRKSDQSIAKGFLREKLRKDIGLKFCDFCLKMVKNHRTVFLLGLCHSWLMDLGNNQQQHPTVYGG